MANATTAWCNQNLNLFPHDGAAITITNTYLAFFTVTPTAAGGGTEVTVASITNYARVPLAGAATWTAPAASTTTNAVQINLIVPAVGSVPTNVVAWGLFDALVGGNLMWFGPVSFTWTVGSNFLVPVGSFALTLV